MNEVRRQFNEIAEKNRKLNMQINEQIRQQALNFREKSKERIDNSHTLPLTSPHLGSESKRSTEQVQSFSLKPGSHLPRQNSR
jgi:hypothetical protein